MSIHILLVSLMRALKMFVLYTTGMYLFEVSNGNTRTICEVCLKLTVNTPERLHSRCSDVLIIFEQISHIALVSQSIVNAGLETEFNLITICATLRLLQERLLTWQKFNFCI